MERIRTIELRNIESKEQLGGYSGQIVTCITNAFGHEMPEDEVEKALHGEHIALAITRDTEEVVGFTKLRSLSSEESVEFGHKPESVGYSLGAATVSKPFQGLGIYRHLNKVSVLYAVEKHAELLVTRTQNPRVEGGLISVMDELAGQNILTYRLERFHQPGFYGRRLTKDPLVTAGTPFSELNIDAGDCFRIIFHLDYRS